MPLEDDILRNCSKVILRDSKSLENPTFGWDDQRMTVKGSDVFGYGFSLPSGKGASFENLDLANECKNQFVKHRTDIIQYTREFSNISREKQISLQENND
jgi:hypothetical protein